MKGTAILGGMQVSRKMQNMRSEGTSSTLAKDTTPQTANGLYDKKRDAKKNFVNITALVRSVQRAEGNKDCFRKIQAHCDQTDCVWRPYCLESHQTSQEEER
jgi:hypothetical protein